MKSCYLSAIITPFGQHNIDPITKDSLHLTGARRGLMLRQRCLEVVALRRLLPADVAYSIVERGELIVATPPPEYRYDVRAS